MKTALKIAGIIALLSIAYLVISIIYANSMMTMSSLGM